MTLGHKKKAPFNTTRNGDCYMCQWMCYLLKAMSLPYSVVQDRRNSSALAMELRRSCTNRWLNLSAQWTTKCNYCDKQMH